MALSALIAAALATIGHMPSPSPAIIWVKADRGQEIVRVAFLSFDVKHAPIAPETLNGVLHYHGKAMPVTMHRKWQGIGAVPEGWVPADYQFDVPQTASGDAVLSLDNGDDGWSFRLGL